MAMKFTSPQKKAEVHLTVNLFVQIVHTYIKSRSSCHFKEVSLEQYKVRTLSYSMTWIQKILAFFSTVLTILRRCLLQFRTVLERLREDLYILI